VANSYTIDNLVRITGSFSVYSSTTLAFAITDPTATSLTVPTAAGFPSSGPYEIVIDAEHIWVTAGQGTLSWSGLFRGYRGTIATAHAIFSPVSSLVGTTLDPTTITLKVKDPNGTTTTYSSPTKDSQGNYHQDVTPTVSGTWWYAWGGTGAVVAQSENYFIVTPPQVG
jgi:hypothetical protein